MNRPQRIRLGEVLLQQNLLTQAQPGTLFVMPGPASAPIPLIERGIDFYREHGCEAIVAVGGGSSMDAAKAIAVSIANPKKNLRSLAGYFKGRHAPVTLYAVPTTAGTGSEVTVAAVISDPRGGGAGRDRL